MPLEVTEPSAYRQVVRIFGTNVKGEQPLYLALCGISGIGRRFAHAVAQRAGLDPLLRAGTMTADEEARLCTVIQNPVEHGIPTWMLNRRFDRATGKDLHWVGSDPIQHPKRNRAPQEDEDLARAPAQSRPESPRAVHKVNGTPRRRGRCRAQEVKRKPSIDYRQIGN
jgi:ribosomal protein S13